MTENKSMTKCQKYTFYYCLKTCFPNALHPKQPDCPYKELTQESKKKGKNKGKKCQDQKLL